MLLCQPGKRRAHKPEPVAGKLARSFTAGPSTTLLGSKLPALRVMLPASTPSTLYSLEDCTAHTAHDEAPRCNSKCIYMAACASVFL